MESTKKRETPDTSIIVMYTKKDVSSFKL